MIIGIRNAFHVDGEDYFLCVKDQGKTFKWMSRTEIANDSKITKEELQIVIKFCLTHDFDPTFQETPLFHHLESFEFIETKPKKQTCCQIS
jgi:hypothetical protein